jgi:DNA invertase Pin-like site-specific DNA recombinase
MPAIRAVAYYRKSNDDDGSSIEQQRKWAQELAGGGEVIILREFADQSKRGWKNSERSAYHEMLEYCQEQARLKNPIEAVVCWHTNRFSRADSIETGHYLHLFREAGVTRLLTAQKWIDLCRGEDRLVFGVTQEAGDHKAVLNLAADSLRGRLDVARDEGRRCGGPIPYGYRPEKEEVVGKHGRRYLRTKRLVLGPDREVEIVRWIFEIYATGQYGVRWIAEQLNRRDPPVPSPRGGLWSHNTVSNILRDEAYLGRNVWNQQRRGRFYGVVGLKVSEVKPGPKRRNPRSEWVSRDERHDPIVSPELFERCAAVLALHAKERNPGTGDFPLSGLIRCGHCGSSMTGRNFKKVSRRTGEATLYRRYECTGYMTHGKAKCHFGCIDADRLAAAVMDKLLPRWLDENAGELREEILRQDRKKADAGDRGRADALQAKVDRLEQEILRATNELIETDSPEQIERLRKIVKDKQKAKTAAGEELGTLEGRHALVDPGAEVDAALAMLARLRQAKDSRDRRAQKSVLRESVTKVEVYFNREQRGERTRSTFAQALVDVPPELWAVLSSAVGSISTGS